MVCLITGSSRGLGQAIALALGKRGHRVAIHYREHQKEAEETASALQDAMTLGGDVRNSSEVKHIVEKVVKRWGSIDLLVNNAGITKESLLIKTSEKEFDDIIATNLKGAFYFTRSVVSPMMKQKKGHIINISSFAGLKGGIGLSAYAASKAGLIGLTLSAAAEMSRYNIMVNAVLPGYMLTNMGETSSTGAQEAALKESLAGTFSNPETVAEFICYLSETSGITGQVFNIDSRII
jgi:3-oxoacyl-[acyl-carrier protein] reductase